MAFIDTDLLNKMTKYCVGAKVKVKSQRWYKEKLKEQLSECCVRHDSPEFGHMLFTDSHARYCGQEATIVKIYLFCVKINIDGEENDWQEWMFEPNPEPPKRIFGYTEEEIKEINRLFEETKEE